jgi:hypothetical protein
MIATASVARHTRSMDLPTTVYVALLDDGTAVWRPVAAKLVGSDLYLLAGPVRDGESWEFAPGSVVHCREQVFADGARGLVAIASA